MGALSKTMTITALFVITSPLFAAFVIRWLRTRSRSKSKSRERLDKVDKALVSKEQQEARSCSNNKDNVSANGGSAPETEIEEELMVCESVKSQLNASINTIGNSEDENQYEDTGTAVSYQEILPQIPKEGLDFPFLTDPMTLDYVGRQDTKVMFVMRGLSGSGKSTIVGVLQSTFKSVAVCSADFFFYKEDGSYAFDANLLKLAHESCQRKAREECLKGTPVVVIDNTNVKRWEMKSYFQTADDYGYVVVLVEPKTPWKLDAEQLFLRSKHGVPLELLKIKVDAFSNMIPSYYAWFLNKPSSISLEDVAIRHFQECLKLFPEFKREILQACSFRHFSNENEEDENTLIGYYSQAGKSSSLLHCTAFFCGKGKVLTSVDYHDQKKVQAACGQVFPLVITGLTMTRKTLGARVTLNQECLSLFKRPEEEDWKGVEEDSFDDDFTVVKGKKKKKSKPPKSKKKSHLKTTEAQRRKGSSHEENVEDDNISNHLSGVNLETKDVSLEEGDGRENKEGLASLNVLYPQLHNSGFGRSCHITIKKARQVESVETNFDVLRVCDIEQKNISNCHLPEFLSVENGEACYYGNGVCCVYFSEPLVLEAMYSGHY